MTHTVQIAAPSDDARPPRDSSLSQFLSLVASLVLHAAAYFVALMFFSGFRGYGDGSLVKGNGDAGISGVFVMSPPGGGGSNSNKVDDPSDQPSETTSTLVFNDPALSAKEPVDEPPVPLLTPLPDTASSLIGSGPPTSVSMPPDLRGVSKASRTLLGGGGPGTGGGTGGGDGTGTGAGKGAGAGTGAGGLGPGETKFFNIREKGLRFVYVVDRSVSMTSHNAIRVAKAELMSSLQSLSADQQFQIIFYNISPTVMHLGGDSQDTMYWASDVNRTLARQFISGITAELGTDHLPALRKALELKPDVVFFLTDAGQPALDSADRAKIRTLNAGRARIHCIEFGMGAELADERSFMEKLASENGGRYIYRDISEFTR